MPTNRCVDELKYATTAVVRMLGLLPTTSVLELKISLLETRKYCRKLRVLQ